MGAAGNNVSTLQADPDIKGRQLGLFGQASNFVNSGDAFAPFTGQRIASPQMGQIAARNFLAQTLGISPFGFMQPQFGDPFQGTSLTGLGGTVPLGGGTGGGTGGPVGDNPVGDSDPIADRESGGEDIQRDPNRFVNSLRFAPSPFGTPQDQGPFLQGDAFDMGFAWGGNTDVARGEIPTGATPHPSIPGLFEYQGGLYDAQGNETAFSSAGPLDARFDPGNQLQPTTRTANDLGVGPIDPTIGFSGGPTGSGLSQEAAQIARQGGFFGPQQVQAPFAGFAGNVGAPIAQQQRAAFAGGVFAPQAQQQNAAFAGDINDPRFSGSRIGELQNAFQDQVIDQSLNDLDQARQRTLQAGVGSAGASTFGGSRSAIREAETNRNFLDAAARQSAQLRSAGFDRATGLAGQELGLGLQAGLANQGTRQGLNQFNAAQGNALGQFNAGLGLQAGLANQNALQNLNLFNAGQGNALNQFNAGQGLQAGLANQGTLQGLNQFNAGLGLQASLANQQAGLAGQGLNLNAAGLLNNIGGDLFGRNLQGASALNQFGTQDQQLAQQFRDANFQQFLDAQNQPVRQIDFLQRILSGVPQDQNQLMGGNTGAGIAGGALSGAGIGAAFGPWGAGIGALGGGLLGLF